jgi:hypothetical protein
VGDEVLSAAVHRETLTNAADSVTEGGKRRRVVRSAVRYRLCCLRAALEWLIQFTALIAV